ncbi:MAG: hypothetical protein ACXWC8_05150 [Limisphaerales bacterium]
MDPRVQTSSPTDLDPLEDFEARRLRSVRAAIEDWDNVCASLPAWEQENLTSPPDANDEDLAQHNRWLHQLLFWGHLFQQALRHPDFPDKSLADLVEKRICHLEDKYSIWHAGMTGRDENRILKDAFD